MFNQKEIFLQIKEISVTTESFKKYQLEIQTALCKCLDRITHTDNNNQDLTNFHRIDQIKIFNKYLINLAL